MKAVILVGGKATRLLPLTRSTPKSMLPVLNKPFMEYVIRHLSRHGIKDIILAQGHLAQPIESCLGDGSRYAVRLTYVSETAPRGTAGAIKNCAAYLDGTFLVLNGDVFTDLDLSAMIKFHRESRAEASISLAPVEDPSSYGVVETLESGRVTRFIEKPPPGEAASNMINAGTYILEPQVLGLIPAGKAVSIERETFPLLLSRGAPVYAYPSAAYWIDIGTPQKYLQLHRDLLQGETRLGGQAEIHPSARIRQSAIGEGCTIAAGCVIEGSVLWRCSHIGMGASIKDSVLAEGCVLHANCTLAGSVLGDGAIVAAGVSLKNAKIEPGARATPA